MFIRRRRKFLSSQESIHDPLDLTYSKLRAVSPIHIYTISHDLKNPLVVIKGYFELLSLESMSKDTAYAVDCIMPEPTVKYSRQSNPSVIQIEGLLINDEIIYRITDNGLGIDAKLIPVIFGLFQRLDNAEDIEGSGVGLAIVKRIIDKHRGKIWVESEVGVGSTFCVVFNS